MQTILLVEDDDRLSQLIAQFLSQNNFMVDVLQQGDVVVDYVTTSPPDLILLDVMLPQLDGFSILRQLRDFYAKPVLFLTAKDSDFDHVKGLEIGADDYIIKPIEPHVLLARINSALRRVTPSSVSLHQKLQFGKLSIDKDTRSITLAQETIELTSHEFELLWLLANQAGEIQSRDFIHQQMLGREYDGFDRSVDVRISRLRKKLNDDLKNPTRIITVWGKGYVFCSTAWE